MVNLPFLKMHGLGNDFVVIDRRSGAPANGLFIGLNEARAIADRHRGVGCDQVVLVDDPSDQGGDVFIRIFNSDGSEVSACGNATRCVGSILLEETGLDEASIRTGAGLLVARAGTEGLISVDMGKPRFRWQDIPLIEEAETLHLNLSLGPLSNPAAVNIGNPHATFFVEDAEAIPLAEIGPLLEVNPIFPEQANIGVAEVKSAGRIRLRVWERGAGITLACGTAACAAIANSVRRELTENSVTVEMDGGELFINLRDNGHIDMTGPAENAFTGFLPEVVRNDQT